MRFLVRDAYTQLAYSLTACAASPAHVVLHMSKPGETHYCIVLLACSVRQRKAEIACMQKKSDLSGEQGRFGTLREFKRHIKIETLDDQSGSSCMAPFARLYTGLREAKRIQVFSSSQGYADLPDGSAFHSRLSLRRLISRKLPRPFSLRTQVWMLP